MYSSMTIHLCSDNYLDRVVMIIFMARSDLAVGAPLGRSRIDVALCTDSEAVPRSNQRWTLPPPLSNHRLPPTSTSLAFSLHTMSYYDQYNSRNSQGAYPPHQYADPVETSYNPYESTQPHQAYEQEGYTYSDTNFNGYRDEPVGTSGPAPVNAEKNVFENETYVASTRALEPKCVAADLSTDARHLSHIALV